MGYLLVIAILLGLIFGPQLWVKHVFEKYNSDIFQMPGNGKQLSEHLLQIYDFKDIKITSNPEGDYFDPASLTLNLIPERTDRNSLTSIVIAAHEISHVIQFYENNIWLKLRQALTKTSMTLNRFSSVSIILFPLVAFVFRSPTIGLLFLLFGYSGLIVNVIVHIVTLPVEIDASFNKALPILKTGEYINSDQEAAARQILQAAAFTYVSAALTNLLNIGRIVTLFRR